MAGCSSIALVAEQHGGGSLFRPRESLMHRTVAAGEASGNLIGGRNETTNNMANLTPNPTHTEL
jgi:hypothetical protein